MPFGFVVGHGMYFLLLLDGPLLPVVAGDGGADWVELTLRVLRRAEFVLLGLPLIPVSLAPVLALAEAGFPLARPASGVAAEPAAGDELLLPGLELVVPDGVGAGDVVVPPLVAGAVGLTGSIVGPLDGCPRLYGDNVLVQEGGELPDQLGVAE